MANSDANGDFIEQCKNNRWVEIERCPYGTVHDPVLHTAFCLPPLFLPPEQPPIEPPTKEDSAGLLFLIGAALAMLLKKR